jgi:hypothetical protein
MAMVVVQGIPPPTLHIQVDRVQVRKMEEGVVVVEQVVMEKMLLSNTILIHKEVMVVQVINGPSTERRMQEGVVEMVPVQVQVVMGVVGTVNKRLTWGINVQQK